MGLNYIKQKDEESSTYNLKFYSNQLDDQLHFIRNLQQQFSLDSDLQKLAFRVGMLEPYEELRLVNSVSGRLATIRNSSEYVINAGVQLNSYNRTISTRQGISTVPNEEWEMIENISGQNPKPLIHYGYGRLFFLEYSNNASIISYVEISIPKLQHTLNRLAPYPSSGVVLTNKYFTQIISEHYDERLVQAIRNDLESKNSNIENGSWILREEGISYRISLNRIPALEWSIYTYVDKNEITGTLRRYNIWFIALSLVSVIVILIFSLSVNRMIHRPLYKLIRAFNMIEMDHSRVPSKWNKANEFDYLYHGFDNMVERLNKSVRENYEHQLTLQKSELKQLQSQINPHFLYNSFYNIYRLCKIGNYDDVAVLTQNLASYYQVITRSGTDEVPLDKEYRHAMDYCDIQGIRFSNRISIETSEVPKACRQLMVPRLIIQPVVENAFEHAFENSAQQGRIYISVECSEGTLTIRIEDDGESLSDESLSELQKKLHQPSVELEKTGLINVCRRIRLKYGESSGVFVSRSDLGGMKAEIIIVG